LFSILLPPPLISLLFPYTTLFRPDSSTVVGGAAEAPEIPDVAAQSDVLREEPHQSAAHVHPEVVLRIRGNQLFEVLHVRSDQSEDRKSTRLNSSHLGISYAVFCLK